MVRVIFEYIHFVFLTIAIRGVDPG